MVKLTHIFSSIKHKISLLLCTHANTYWICNIYGDAILLYNGSRSIHRCVYCKKTILKDGLYGEEYAKEKKI
jgi:hypothetical protein